MKPLDPSIIELLEKPEGLLDLHKTREVRHIDKLSEDRWAKQKE